VYVPRIVRSSKHASGHAAGTFGEINDPTNPVLFGFQNKSDNSGPNA